MLDGVKTQQARKRKGWTQEEMAERLHVSSKTLQRYELGKTQPGWAMHKLIAEVLGVDPQEIERVPLAS